MLTQNVWTDNRLFNGAFGYVRHVVWPAGTVDCRTEPPSAIFVAFDNYTGPSLIEKDSEKLVPILRSKKDWAAGGITLSRTQFPLVLVYVISVHKSQGISIDRAVLSISRKADCAPGITYVALSRVKTLEGILFTEQFDISWFKTKPTKTTQMRAEDEQRRKPYRIGEEEDDDDTDLPSYAGAGSQMTLTIRSSSPTAGSSGTSLPSSAWRGVGAGASEDAAMGGADDTMPPPPPPPPIGPTAHPYTGLIPLNPAQYDNAPVSSAVTRFQCHGNGRGRFSDRTGCDDFMLDIKYQAIPGVNHCIWCNNNLPMSYPGRQLWCEGFNQPAHNAPASEFLTLSSDWYGMYCKGCES
jgi:hypothetical protein